MQILNIAGAFITKALDLMLGALLHVLSTLFNLVFFWLPDDPFIDYITSASTALQTAAPSALGWLNWFIPFGTLAPILVLLVDCFLVWAAFRILMYLAKTIAAFIDGMPVIG